MVIKLCKDHNNSQNSSLPEKSQPKSGDNARVALKTYYVEAQVKRPQYLLSGLLVCGACGGGFSKINSARYGCSAARNKGESVCNSKKTIKRSMLESTVLNAL